MKNENSWCRETASEELLIDSKLYKYISLKKMMKQEFTRINQLPYTIRLLLESAVRHADGYYITDEHIAALANWQGGSAGQEIPFKPARIVFQDFTGIPAIVDLASMRDAVAAKGGNPALVNPQIPVDLVIDHSVIIEHSGDAAAYEQNLAIEYERNAERYEFVRWAQKSFENFHVVPPANGIVHQVNLEYLATGIRTEIVSDVQWIYPDSLVGTDSHTPMINGIGTVGWGVGGIEAESAMLDQPLYFTIPDVVGVKLTGSLPEGVTATDLALTVTNKLRTYGVVGKFVEFYGEGLRHIPVTDRVTISNMAPEYGATMSFFPTDKRTIEYFRQTGREDAVPLIEGYLYAQGLFMDETSVTPSFSETLEIDLRGIVPTVSGPKKPQDIVALTDMKRSFEEVLEKPVAEGGYNKRRTESSTSVQDGSIVLASITSCTNTSNPSVMVAAGLVAERAAALGLRVPSYVKTTLTPGSRVVTRYLEKANLLEPLEQLGFYVDGYGCATCCGNSGALMPQAEEAILKDDVVAASILSGNRNFEGRVHPQIRANYLASPPLVVAFALAGRIDIDFDQEPIGKGTEGQSVYLADVWPEAQLVERLISETVDASLFKEEYAGIYSNETWESIPAAEGMLYDWNKSSTYIQRVPYFDEVLNVSVSNNTQNMVPLLVLDDSITTDHISPAGHISLNSEAGRFLSEQGISPRSYNNYGARRGNHHIMMRGTFANIRLRNQLVPGVEGGYTIHRDTAEQVSIFEAAQRYKKEQRNLIILAGKEYGTGSSRDWAAKGTSLLGVKVVLAESFERIHRSNLAGMGVLPIQFSEGGSVSSYDLDGTETYTLDIEDNAFVPVQRCKMKAIRANGESISFPVLIRIDNVMEKDAYIQGGLLPSVAESMLSK